MLARSVIGALLALLALTPVFVGARALRRRLVPELAGPPAALAEIVLDLSLVVGVTELLGTIGAFRLLPVLLSLGAVGVAAMRVGRARPAPDRRPSPSSGAPPEPTIVSSANPTRVGPTRTWRWATIIAVSVVSAEWMSRVVDSWRRGMSTTDTLWYHLPMAARFVQDGWTTRLHFVDARSLIVFYPETSELLHATLMLFLGNDVLSLVVNLGWLALALLSAWCIGRRFGVPHLTLIGAVVVLATPQVVLDDAGSGLTDIVGLALFLAAVALVSNAAREGVGPRERRAEMLCGALAAGLAAGTKYTLVIPVVLLALGVIVLTPRRERIRFTMRWLAVAGLAGGYWYIRNFIAVGSPIPNAHLGVGPLHLPTIPFPGTSSVAHFLFQRGAWSTYLLPGLHGAFGPVWWSVAAAAGAGFVLGLMASEDLTVKILAFIGFGCFVAYVVTPQIVGARAPTNFQPNVRYVIPALVMGTVALPIVLRRWPRIASALAVAYLIVLGGTQFAGTIWRHVPSGYAPSVEGATPVVIGICFGILVAAFGVLWNTAGLPRLRLSEHPAAFVTCAIVAVVGLGIAGLSAEQYALSHRYRHIQPMVSIYRWAQGVHNARIAIVDVSLQYPLYGKDLSNHVQYLAVRHANGVSEPIRDCRSWRRAVNKGRYQYVVAATPGFPFANKAPAVEAAWTRSDPAAHLLLTDSASGAHAWLFEIRGALDPDGCAAAARP